MRIPALLTALLLTTGCSDDVASPEANGSDDVTTSAAANSGEKPPYFAVDENASGPLTMEELNINIPDHINARLSDQKRACFLAAIERRAREAGDPRDLSVDSGPYATEVVNQAQWDMLEPYQQRVLLAQRVLNGAFNDC